MENRRLEHVRSQWHLCKNLLASVLILGRKIIASVGAFSNPMQKQMPEPDDIGFPIR